MKRVLLLARPSCRYFSSGTVVDKLRGISPTQHRTGITAQLWDMRQRLKEKTDKASPSRAAAPSAPRTPVAKSPRDSATEILMPFASDLKLRDQYMSPFGHLRVGRLLEDLDAMAGNVAFRHADDGQHDQPLLIVTASVDSIRLLNTLAPDRDLKMHGYVTWVGKSSMEIQVDCHARVSPTDFEPILHASFTMVAKDPATKGAATVNPLIAETDEEKLRFSEGELNRKRRLSERQASLNVQAPTADERFIIHDLFMAGRKSSGGAAAASSFVPMSLTVNQSVILCQPSERNIHNTIFGGYLMRKGFELAFSTAYLFARSQPVFVMLNETTFHKPVQIGSILTLNSTVVYTKEKFVQVEVAASVTDPAVGRSELTNVFSFTFRCPEYQDHEIKRVLPQTYEEAMRYLEGRRKHEKDIKDLAAVVSAGA